MRVKILGAGSVGNHLAHAAVSLGWTVDLCDIDEAALVRTKNAIYPSRYGKWDESIRLFGSRDAPSGGYDMIFIGTPPESHMALALEAVSERPHAVLVEKPLCTPDLAGARELLEACSTLNVPLFVGYDHAVGEAGERFAELASGNGLDGLETLDVEFREHWGGIFAAHTWLDGPADSYLGYWKRGGGASCEHSHALHLWQHFAHSFGAGRVVEVQAMMDFVVTGGLNYDKLSLMHLRTDGGLSGRVVQDVVTSPPRKWARAQGRDGYLEWKCGYRPGVDAVFEGNGRSEALEHLFPKTRPDDFIQELRHIEASIRVDPAMSGLSLERGFDTMLVVAAAHKSVREKRTVLIDYSCGHTEGALK